MGRMIDIAAVAFCIGAGVYLLSAQTVGANSFLEVLAHGIGAYFVGKGLFIGKALYLSERQLRVAETSTELSAYEHQHATVAD